MSGFDSSHNDIKKDKKVFEIVKGTPRVKIGSEEDKDGINEFDQMDSAERYTLFQNQAYTIKQLKRKLRTGTKTPSELARKMFSQAEEIVKQADVELEDQRDLLKNLVTAINEGKLEVGSLQFDRICTIVRNALEDKKEGEAIFSLREQAEYGSLLKLQSINNILCGKPVERKMTERDIVEQYVLMQSDFFRVKTFQEFIDSVSRNGPE